MTRIRHGLRDISLQVVTIMGALLLGSGCDVADPSKDVALVKAPAEAKTFFTSGIEIGILYAYITADGGIFVYRHDLDQCGWITLDQFKKFVTHAKPRGGRLVYSMEDGDLKQAAAAAAFEVINSSHMDTQDPVDIPPFVKQEILKRSKH